MINTKAGSQQLRRAKRVKANLPTVLAEKVLETKSRAIFAEAVSPWLVTDWSQHDYGVDAIVEVTRARESGDNLDATGKRFAVQLKATEGDISGERASVRVRPEQIRYWLGSTEAVLIVLCHVPSRALYWRWIDHQVVEELNRRDPSWIGQETVSVGLPTSRPIDAAALKEMAGFVFAYRRAARRVLAPGTYLALHGALSEAAEKLSSRARAAGFESVTKRLADLESSVRTSTYVVALAGPARAGKSTLLNALVGREVSPVGRLPTTAVSLMVTSGAKDEAEVVLVDDTRVRGDATAAFLAQYATQENNPDNQKQVRMVVVRLVSEVLERGVAFADAPGLHDPSPEIRLVTETALQSAHAVLYVLDVSPARNGGFSVNAHHLDDLKRLRNMAERLFIVLNKADVLTAGERDEVAIYLEQVLRKYGLWESLPRPPMFISAGEGWEWQRGGRSGDSPLGVLDEAIWAHLLCTNSTGLDRLGTAMIEVQRAAGDFASLLASARVSGAEAFTLRASLEACRVRERELSLACRQRVGVDEAFVRERLTEHCAVLLARLQQRLDGIPADQALPAQSQIQKELQDQVMNLLADVWRESSARFQTFASYISQEVEKSLQQARMATGTPDQVRFRLPQVPALNVAGDSFEEAWTGLFTGGLFGLLIGGPWGWALAAGGFLAGVFLGRERRRKREVARVVERARGSLVSALDAVFLEVGEKIRLYLASLQHHVADRILVFVHDVEGQLKRLDAPVSPAEQRELEGHEQAVREILAKLVATGERLELGGTR